MDEQSVADAFLLEINSVDVRRLIERSDSEDRRLLFLLFVSIDLGHGLRVSHSLKELLVHFGVVAL